MPALQIRAGVYHLVVGRSVAIPVAILAIVGRRVRLSDWPFLRRPPHLPLDQCLKDFRF